MLYLKIEVRVSTLQNRTSCTLLRALDGHCDGQRRGPAPRGGPFCPEMLWEAPLCPPPGKLRSVRAVEECWVQRKC